MAVPGRPVFTRTSNGHRCTASTPPTRVLTPTAMMKSSASTALQDTSSITAVVIGQLVDDRRLSFSDPVSKFLGGKGWTSADLSTIRVEHLLSHTSGLGSYSNDTYDRTARHGLRRVDDYKPLVAGETLAFEPGTRWQYSNTGFLLAGAVIESRSARPWVQTMAEVRVRGMFGGCQQRRRRTQPRLVVSNPYGGPVCRPRRHGGPP